MQRVQAVPPQAQSVALLDALQAAAAPVLPLLYEAEAHAFLALLDERRRPLLPAWLQAELAADAAQDTAHERLLTFEQRHRAALAMLSTDDAARLRTTLAALQSQARDAETRASAERRAADAAATPKPAASVYRGAGAPYLIALVEDDVQALAEMDGIFGRIYREYADEMVRSGMHQLTAQLFRMPADPSAGQRLQRMAAAVSMATPLAGAYIASYEHLFPAECMDANPVEVTKTIQHQGAVWRNLMGVEISRTPAWTERRHFRINGRFEAVFLKVTDEFRRQQGLDIFLARPGQMRLTDVIASLQEAMRSHRCDGPEMQLLERRLMDRFHLVDERMRRIAQGR
jgi:hypothetical protein